MHHCNYFTVNKATYPNVIPTCTKKVFYLNGSECYFNGSHGWHNLDLALALFVL